MTHYSAKLSDFKTHLIQKIHFHCWDSTLILTIDNLISRSIIRKTSSPIWWNITWYKLQNFVSIAWFLSKGNYGDGFQVQSLCKWNPSDFSKFASLDFVYPRLRYTDYHLIINGHIYCIQLYLLYRFHCMLFLSRNESVIWCVAFNMWVMQRSYKGKPLVSVATLLAVNRTLNCSKETFQ